MPGGEEVLRVVRGWIEKAESDLTNAVHTLGMGEWCPVDTVCFHAQQCAEKYLKALLVSTGIDFPKMHDIGELIALVPRKINVGLSAEEQRRLTTYATVTRYPGDYEPISLADARRAIALARRVRREVRRLLPSSALRRRRS